MAGRCGGNRAGAVMSGFERFRRWFHGTVVIQTVILVALSGVLINSGLAGLGGSRPASAASDPVIAAVGDIACDVGSVPTSTSCQQSATANLVAGLGANTVLPL